MRVKQQSKRWRGTITEGGELLLVHGVGRTVDISQIEDIVVRAEGGVRPTIRDVAMSRLAMKFDEALSQPMVMVKQSLPGLYAHGRETVTK